ncbi:hypothetical protein SAMN05192569_102838 [Parageobacillus thermantarcticus]|uniref:Uncharacterized protein n=1 Tax=Parageobacillus thermantarcticus TaxID=186116 RepID=A0A1I0TGX7_9BACL|nr:hypothetical protein [Parageobacillus thermantarcticus]SFA51010.1 hypothetical protein SAMN05192569_102838 [Parageobacillus thermantarcticus]
MNKTKLDLNRFEHQLLAGIITAFVDDFGYTPREVFELLNDTKQQMWHALSEIANQKRGEK